MNFFPCVQYRCLILFILACRAFPVHAQAITRGDLAAARHALELRMAQTGPDSAAAQREADTREAERAALLARLPPNSSRPLEGRLDARGFGAAGLVRAFDLARGLAVEVCAALPQEARTAVHDPATSAGVAAARGVNDAHLRLADELARRNKDMQLYIDAHTPPGAFGGTLAVALTVVPAVLRAGADTSSLFKTDVTASSLAYGEGARALFVSALAEACPQRIAGLGGGYLGELDAAQHERLLGKLRALANHRADYAHRIALLQKLADAAKGDEKRDVAGVATAAGAVLKAVDAFIESLRAGESGDRSPLANAARYLGYAQRTEGAPVLDFDLRLEGMSIVKDNLFTGQKLRLSAIGLLWYRVHAADGSLRLARTARKMAEPVEVDLRGEMVGGKFWDGR
jgi:2-hydroxychromene-2-carboxylate isomerase